MEDQLHELGQEICKQHVEILMKMIQDDTFRKCEKKFLQKTLDLVLLYEKTLKQWSRLAQENFRLNLSLDIVNEDTLREKINMERVFVYKKINAVNSMLSLKLEQDTSSCLDAVFNRERSWYVKVMVAVYELLKEIHESKVDESKKVVEVLQRILLRGDKFTKDEKETLEKTVCQLNLHSEISKQAASICEDEKRLRNAICDGRIAGEEKERLQKSYLDLLSDYKTCRSKLKTVTQSLPFMMNVTKRVLSQIKTRFAVIPNA